MFLFILLFAVAAFGCPRFVEFFPDPVDVSDSEGEFVEIVLDKADLNQLYSKELKVTYDGKTTITLPYPNTERILLTHEAYPCEENSWYFCGTLGSISLPNSRETTWLLEIEDCIDSVVLPKPKSGKSLQRYGEEWVVATPTPGVGNPDYEDNLKICRIDSFNAVTQDSSVAFEIQFLECDSVGFVLKVDNLWNGNSLVDTSKIYNQAISKTVAGKAFRIQGEILEVTPYQNNFLDTMVFIESPIVISEIHHCPNEPEPEWAEIYNGSLFSIPLDKFRFCSKGGYWWGNIEAKESLLFSKDTATLREYLGYNDVSLLQVSMGYLNNTSGSLSICYGDLMVDSVYWDKNTVKCPLGFNPLTGRAENTPGYQNKRVNNNLQKELTYKLPSRVVRKNKGALLIYIESEGDVELKLLDSSGRTAWNKTVPGNSNSWWKVPADTLLDIGVGYVTLAIGKNEKSIGILVRP